MWHVNSNSFLLIAQIDKHYYLVLFSRNPSLMSTCTPAVFGVLPAMAWTALWSCAPCLTGRWVTGCYLKTWVLTLWLPRPPLMASKNQTSIMSCPDQLGEFTFSDLLWRFWLHWLYIPAKSICAMKWWSDYFSSLLYFRQRMQQIHAQGMPALVEEQSPGNMPGHCGCGSTLELPAKPCATSVST